MPKGMQPIFTNVISTGGSLSFTNIPQTYTDLYITASIKDNTSGGGVGQTIYMTLNGDGTSSYSARWLESDGTNRYTTSNSNQTGFRLGVVQSTAATSGIYSNLEIYLPNYTNNIFKSYLCEYVTENSGTGVYIGTDTGVWRKNAPITTIAIGTGFALNQFTSWNLYGLSGS
jgi:hypothetical protein